MKMWHFFLWNLAIWQSEFTFVSETLCDYDFLLSEDGQQRIVNLHVDGICAFCRC